MKNKKLCLSALLSLLAMLAYAQHEYTFKVLVNKGKNEVKSGDTWQPLKTGTSLKPSDELKITENAYIGLIHVSGKPLEVKQAGKYKVVDLAGRIKDGSSVLNKYTDFILSANTEKKNNLAATGAVHRGFQNVKVNLPKTEVAVVYNNNIMFNWETDKASGPYTVTFNSMFGDELKQIDTNDNRVSIDLNDPSFTNEDNILVRVIPKSDPNKQSDEYTLKRLSNADKNRIRNSLNEIKETVAEPTAINKLVLAGFYESNNLFIDAITAYLEAIKLAPDVQEFKDQYNDFLLRNAIKEPPIKK